MKRFVLLIMIAMCAVSHAVSWKYVETTRNLVDKRGPEDNPTVTLVEKGSIASYDEEELQKARSSGSPELPIFVWLKKGQYFDQAPIKMTVDPKMLVNNDFFTEMHEEARPIQGQTPQYKVYSVNKKFALYSKEANSSHKYWAEPGGYVLLASNEKPFMAYSSEQKQYEYIPVIYCPSAKALDLIKRGNAAESAANIRAALGLIQDSQYASLSGAFDCALIDWSKTTYKPISSINSSQGMKIASNSSVRPPTEAELNSPDPQVRADALRRGLEYSGDTELPDPSPKVSSPSVPDIPSSTSTLDTSNPILNKIEQNIRDSVANSSSSTSTLDTSNPILNRIQQNVRESIANDPNLNGRSPEDSCPTQTNGGTKEPVSWEYTVVRAEYWDGREIDYHYYVVPTFEADFLVNTRCAGHTCLECPWNGLNNRRIMDHAAEIVVGKTLSGEAAGEQARRLQDIEDQLAFEVKKARRPTGALAIKHDKSIDESKQRHLYGAYTR